MSGKTILKDNDTKKAEAKKPYQNEPENRKLKKTITRMRHQKAFFDEKIRETSAEIKVMDEDMKRLSLDVESYKKRIGEYPDKISELELETEALTAEVNKNRQKIKTVKSDEESTLLLIDTLRDEYRALKKDKTELTRRIRTLHQVIEDLNNEKEEKLPRLKEYDAMLKNAWYEMQETENSMDISLKLWHRKSSYKPAEK